MKVWRVGESWRASRITGPSHNFLGLKFGDCSVGSPLLVKVSAAAGEESIDFSETTICSWVQEALAEANIEFGQKYNCTQIEYVPSDTLDKDNYRQLVFAIVQHIVDLDE